MQQADVTDAAATPSAPAPPARARERRRSSRALEVTGFVIIGALLVGAIAAAFGSLYREFWGPSAFAERYVQLLADGRAADALAVDGVAVSSEALEEAGLPSFAHDALLRSAAVSDALDDIRATSEKPVDGDPDAVDVTVGYRLGDEAHESTFRIERTGWSGLAPTWQFASSPLTVVNVDVQGSWRFSVNGFELDKRQVSPDGLTADPADPIPMLAFTPMAYDVSVDTATTAADPVRSEATEPLTAIDARVEAHPTQEFADVVDDEAESWLSEGCGSRNVLLPEDCPYGYQLENRLAPGTQPEWSITTYPDIELVPDGAWWRIKDADGVAHIEMDVQSYIDGSISHVSEDVPFRIDGTVELLQDGSAKIKIGAPLLR